MFSPGNPFEPSLMLVDKHSSIFQKSVNYGRKNFIVGVIVTEKKSFIELTKDKFYDFRDYTIEDLKKPEQQMGWFFPLFLVYEKIINLGTRVVFSKLLTISLLSFLRALRHSA